MALPITTGSFAKALWPGVHSWYGKAYNEYPVEWDKLFEVEKSMRNYEEIIQVATFGLAQVKNEGGGINYDSERQGFVTRFTHVVYGLGFIITREMYEDDQYDVVAARRSESIAFSIRQTKEVLGANVYNRAFSGSYLGADGVSLISPVHPNISGGTFSNTLSINADLSEAALEQAVIQIAALQDDRGKIIAVVPETLIIPWTQEFEAHRILKAQGRVGTDNNDPNALKDLGKFRKGMVTNHFLTDLDSWYIRTNVPKSMISFERRADEFTSDNDFDTENAKFKATFRQSWGWADPRGLFASPGA